MKEFFVPKINGDPCWETIPKLPLSYSLWETTYAPETFAQLCYLEEEGLFVRMTSLEPYPLARYQENNDPVFLDSCLECFLQFFPEQDDRYLNFEANPLGTMRCGVGSEREERTSLWEGGYPVPPITPFSFEEGWGIQWFIPLALLTQVYGDFSLKKGTRFRGNFYKCGDETPNPHYLSWSPILDPSPNFHHPENFGYFQLDS